MKTPSSTFFAAAFSLLAAFLPAGNSRADFITGQAPDLLLGAPATPVFDPVDVAVDPLTLKVWICDREGNRVLRYSSTEAMQSDGAPEAVLGQRDEFSTVPGTSATGMKAPRGIATDNFGRLWVADTENHRVLRFDGAATLATGAAASAVIGQVNFTSAVAATTENRLNTPYEVAVDQSGRLWVADTGNNRILRWDSPATMAPGTPASAVLGQSNFTSSSFGASATGLDSPRGVAFEHSSGVLVRLWVADTGSDRVLAYNSPASKANGAAADKVLGAPNFTTSGSPVPSTTRNTFAIPSGLAMEGTTLWVADSSNNRLLRFLNAGSKANGADADAVLGQFGFTEKEYDSTLDRLRRPLGIAVILGRLWVADWANKRIVRHDAASSKIALAPADGTLGQPTVPPGNMTSPQATAIDPVSGKLFVADYFRNRVLRYASARALQSGAQPEAVIGQPDLNSYFSGTSASRISGPGGLTVDQLGNLWVSDSGNARVLQFAGAANLSTGAAAVRVLGQPGFNASTPGLSATLMEMPFGLTTEAGPGPGGTTVITRLWVVDGRNSRVLRYDNPLSLANGSAASGVLGQPGFTTKTQVTTATGMAQPGTVAVDGAGRLWVTDGGNDRVLRYDNAAAKANGAAANGVLGQSSFTSTANAFSVTSVCLSPTGRLFVSSFDENRVLWFDNAASLANGAAPHGVLGQPDLVSTAPGGGFHGMTKAVRVTLDPFSGQLWVAQDNMLQRYTPTGPLGLWRMANFGTSANTGSAANDADPDGDGMANLMEYINGQDPNVRGGLGFSPVVGVSFDAGSDAMVADLRLLTTYDSKVKLTLQYTFNPAAGWNLLSTRTGTGAWTGITPYTTTQLGGGRTRFGFDGGFNPAIFKKTFFRLKAEELP